MKDLFIRASCMAFVWQALAMPANAQQPQSRPAAATPSGAPTAPAVTPRFVIGAGDILAITFWRDQKLSGDVVVRPDGMISVPLLNDVRATGRTPEQLADALHDAAVKYIADPDVTVIVKQINSRRVFLIGAVGHPGMITLNDEMNVLQLIAVGGGLLDYADRGNIVIVRNENGQEKRLKFNYDDVLKGKNTKQNILLQPGDTVVVR